MADSVALVVLDTLRKDAFDEHFDWLPGRSFERALSPSHWTVPVHGALFAGVYPSESGVHALNPVLDCPQTTLAEKLSQNGWTCRGFSANGNISPSTDFDRGFHEFTAKGYHSDADVFDWGEYIEASQGASRYLRTLWACLTANCDTFASLRRGIRIKYDDVRYGGPPNLTVADAHSYIRDANFGNQEFLFLNLMEAHDSYTPPSEYRTVDPPNVDSITALGEVLDPDGNIDSTRYRQSYQDSVRYLSERYQDIYDDLKDDFEYVITISDHGEAFGDDRIYGHIPSLVPDIVHVPLSITGPDVAPGESHAAVNLIDVHRTVSDITGVESPPRGHNLLDPDSRPTLTEAHGVSDWQRNALQERNVPPERLAIIEDIRRGVQGEDYYAYDSLFDDWLSTDRGERARTELELLVDDLSERTDSGEDVSEEVRSHLEDMGYA